MFTFVKKVFFIGLTVLSSSITGALNCVSTNNQECKLRPEIVDVSTNPVLRRRSDVAATSLCTSQ